MGCGSIRCRIPRIALYFLPVVAAFPVYVLWGQMNLSLVEVETPARSYSRRTDHFTVNVCGTVSSLAKALEYQLNDGDWLSVKMEKPRVPEGSFIIELRADVLRKGMNELKIRAYAYGRSRAEVITVPINYDPTPIVLPLRVDWSSEGLELSDGLWERFRQDGEWRVRPKPGSEEYDRILVVAGSFPGPRRVETDVIFRSAIDRVRYGYGLLTLWGGHPDEPGSRLGRGWLYGQAWYASRYDGVASEFSAKYGDRAAVVIASSQVMPVSPGRKYRIVAETWPEATPAGRQRYRQHMKWWEDGTPEPEYWIELGDTANVMPLIEYGVALVAHRCQADFGPVIIKPLTGSAAVSLPGPTAAQ